MKLPVRDGCSRWTLKEGRHPDERDPRWYSCDVMGCAESTRTEFEKAGETPTKKDITSTSTSTSTFHLHGPLLQLPPINQPAALVLGFSSQPFLHLSLLLAVASFVPQPFQIKRPYSRRGAFVYSLHNVKRDNEGKNHIAIGTDHNHLITLNSLIHAQISTLVQHEDLLRSFPAHRFDNKGSTTSHAPG